MLRRILRRVLDGSPAFAKLPVIRRAFCWLGVHKLRKGFGWANGRRYDCCYNCKYSRWVDDVEGYEEVCSSSKRHGV